jgi:putative RecB family exonuclease
MTDGKIKKLVEEGIEEQTRKILIKLSASRAKTFDQCARKYYYSYIEKLPTKEWNHLELGTYVHSALEIFHRYIKDGSKELPRKLMGISSSEAFKKMTDSGKTLPDEFLQEAKTMLSDYLSQIEQNGMPNVLEVEFPFTIPLNDHYDLAGVIDRIDRDSDGILHIRDYKTSKSSKYMDSFQLNTYGLLLLDRFPDTKHFRASYIMLKLGQVLPYEFTADDVTKCREKLVKYADRITSEERWRSKPSRLCDWCDFKDVCFNSW